jgi:hypothetical protein
VDSQIGPYKIIGEITQGTFEPAFEAVDRASDKRVTLKYLGSQADSSDIRERLHSESLARLNHPNAARLFGFVCRDERIYLVMEFVEGQTLASRLKEQDRFDPVVALGLFHQLLSAVSFAHNLGVIHGNLRPSNIMVTDVGLVKVLDFPVSYILGNSGPFDYYAAPEQVSGDPLDARSDIYSLGMLLYEMIVGRRPFDLYGLSGREAQFELIPVPPSVFVPNIPRWLNAFVLRALAVAPGNRFQSAQAMAQAMKLPVAPARVEEGPGRRRVWRRRCASWIGSATGPPLKIGSRCVESSKVSLARWAGALEPAVRRAADIAEASARRGVLLHQLRASALAAPIRRSLFVQNRLLGSVSQFPVRSLQVQRTRCAWVLCLIVLATGETFYFRGAHVVLLFDSLTSGSSVNEAVDAMYERLHREASNTERVEIKQTETKSALEPKMPPLQAPIEQRKRTATVARMPEPAAKIPRTIRETADPIVSKPEKQANPVVVDAREMKEGSASEPTRTARSNQPKTQLNVQWEN